MDPSHTEISSAANNLFPVHRNELHNVPMKSGYKLSPNPNSNQEWPSENSSQTLLNKLPRCNQSGSSSTSNSKANSEPTKNPVEGLGFIQNKSENLDSNLSKQLFILTYVNVLRLIADVFVKNYFPRVLGKKQKCRCRCCRTRA